MNTLIKSRDCDKRTINYKISTWVDENDPKKLANDVAFLTERSSIFMSIKKIPNGQ